MRALTIISLLVCAGCTVRMPRPGEIGIRVKSTTRVEARGPAHVQVHGQGQIHAQGQVHVEVQPPPPPPPPDVLVEIQGAPVVEFFGIPLEGAQDVVFVLDVSGSMSELAQGRLATIQVASVPASAPPPPPDAYAEQGAPPPDAYGAQGAPPPSEGPPPPPPHSPPPPDSVSPPDAPPATAPPVTGVVAGTPRKIDVAQAELVDALQRLPAGTRMNVIFFNRDLEGYAPAIVPLDEPGRAALIDFVRGTAPQGSTALTPAMRTAFLMNPRRIVLLSDGFGNVGGGADVLLRDAREAIRGGVRIDTIGIGGQNAWLLRTLANESGGLYQRL